MDHPAKTANKATRPSARRSRKTFTKARRAVLTEYVAYLQGVLRITNWHVTIDFDDPSPEALADISAPPHQKWATLRLGKGFLDLSPQMQTQTLIHELTHCVLFGIQDVSEDVIEASTSSKKALQVGTAAVSGAVEVATDHVADILLPMLRPLDLP